MTHTASESRFAVLFFTDIVGSKDLKVLGRHAVVFAADLNPAPIPALIL